MKNKIILISLLLIVLILSVSGYIFSKQPDKNTYIEAHFPLLKENLSLIEQQEFKESLQFNWLGKMSSCDAELLEKGAGDQFGIYYQHFSTELTGVSQVVGIVNPDGTEIIIDTDGTIVSRTNVSTKEVVNKEIVGNTIRSYKDKEYNVSELLTEDGLFIVTSTGCGPCVTAYPELNELTKNKAFSKINFVALYRDSFQKINTFKGGSMFQQFGELNAPWIIFSSDELIKKYNSKYDFKGVPYVFIKKGGEIIYQNYGINLDKIKNELAKL